MIVIVTTFCNGCYKQIIVNCMGVNSFFYLYLYRKSYLSTDSTNTRKAFTCIKAQKASLKFTFSHLTKGPWNYRGEHVTQCIHSCCL